MTTPNYWVAGAGKCAQSALVDQIQQATGYDVWGHDHEFMPYTHQPHTIVHTNQTPIPPLPYGDYTCTMILRRDLIQQAMESWIQTDRTHINVVESMRAFTNYLMHIKLRIIRASDQPWAERCVVYAEDLLEDTAQVMHNTYLLSSTALQPNLNQTIPHVQLTYYREIRQHLTYRFAQDFDEVDYLLKQFLK